MGYRLFSPEQWRTKSNEPNNPLTIITLYNE